ncbi:MAG: hypothetical protein KKF52_03540 [Nanoarchaeota archaeon]|nr:hypothetical protein [Nanoarchaeota archaeon]MBU4242279.1 hypothetical protein [Nanoarchaeota archaeon]MBU4352606.1 hypothetical protein [Nanoarchaeota archaeon]
MKSNVILGNERLKNSFNKLKTLKIEDKQLYSWLVRAFKDLEEDAFIGIQIQKKLIPKDYKPKFGKIDNLWKYNLPNAWRLIYTIKKDQIIVLSIILEWMSHKEYERKFNY